MAMKTRLEEACAEVWYFGIFISPIFEKSNFLQVVVLILDRKIRLGSLKSQMSEKKVYAPELL